MALDTYDPIASRSYSIEINGLTIAQFRDCAGIQQSIAVTEVRENLPGGQQVIRKIPGQMSHGDITLKRGRTADNTLATWFKQVCDGDIKGARRNGAIVLYDSQHGEVYRLNITNAWPTKYTASEFSASGSDVMVETLDLELEQVVRVK